MALSYYEYTADGVQVNYASKQYVDEAHLVVSLDGVAQASSTYTVSGTTLTFNNPPPTGTVIRIGRNSNQDARLTNYEDASLLTADVMDDDANQLFYMAQEAIDTASETNVGVQKFYNASATAPASPAIGDLWYDTYNKYLKIYNGTQWDLATPSNETYTFDNTSFVVEGANYHYINVANLTEDAFVFLNGVKLVEGSTQTSLISAVDPSDYYLDLANNRVYFATLDAADVVEVVIAPADLGTNNNTQLETFTATEGQTIFDLTKSYVPATNTLHVYVNGVRQSAYAETLSTRVTFTNGLSAGDEVTFITNQYAMSQSFSASENVTYTPTGGSATTVDVYLKSQNFTSVAKMKLSTLPVGATASTKGFNSVGDGGAATYMVVAPKSANGFDEHLLANGNVAVLQADATIHAEQFGWPVSEAGATLNAAMAFASSKGYSEVYYSTPCDNQTTTISLPSRMVLVGPQDNMGGEIKMADGVPASVVQAETSGFLGDLVSQPAETSTGLHAACGFRNVFLNGNKDNRTGTITDWKEGIGFRAYWINPHVQNLQIHGQPGIGLYSQFDRGYVPNFLDKIDSESILGFIDKLRIRNCGYEGMIFNGPSDIKMDNIGIGWCANSAVNTTYDSSLRSLKYPTETVDTFVFDRFGCEVGFAHIFGNKHGWGTVVKNTVNSDGVRIKFEYLMNESCFGGAHFAPEARVQASMVDLHNNTGGDGSRPHLKDETAVGCILTNVEVYRGGVENGCNSIEISGIQSTYSAVNIYGKARAGHGIVFDNGGANIVNACNIDGVRGTNYAGEISAGVVTRDGALKNTFSGRVSGSDRMWVHEGTSRVGSFDITGSFNSTSTLATGLDNIPASEWAANCKLMHYASGANTDAQGALRALTSVSNTTTSEQTIIVSHNLARPCSKADVLNSIANQSGAIGSIDYIRVNSVSATEIDVRVKMASAGTGTSWLVTNVY